MEDYLTYNQETVATIDLDEPATNVNDAREAIKLSVQLEDDLIPDKGTVMFGTLESQMIKITQDTHTLLDVNADPIFREFLVRKIGICSRMRRIFAKFVIDRLSRC